MVLVTYFCQHFHFLCVLCVSRKYPYTIQGELLEIPSRVGREGGGVKTQIFIGHCEEGSGGGFKPNNLYGRGVSGTTHCFTAIHETIVNLCFILNTYFRLSNLEELVVNHNELEVNL